MQGCGGRNVLIETVVEQKIDTKEVAQILARYVTGGNYSGYLEKIAQNKLNIKEKHIKAI